jgi:hypothetical protein
LAAVDYERIGSGLQQLKQGTPGATGNGGTTGGTDPLSTVKLRAPQCEGITYAASDRASADEAARAVTAVDLVPSDGGVEFPESDGMERIGRIEPIVFGVLDNGRSLPAGGPVDQWNAEHEKAGRPAMGIAAGACGTSCSSSLGQACTPIGCRSYPVVSNNTVVRFSGANFWDLKTARLRLTRLADGDVTEVPISGLQIDEIEGLAELPGRCDPTPVTFGDVGRDLGVTDGPPITPPCSGTLCLDLYERGVRPNENRLEYVDALIKVDNMDEFYTVQVVNFNGSYIPWNEEVPFDLEDLDDLGRTVHVCKGPKCAPPPHEVDAACSILNMPACGAAVGGVWSTPPRSLTECEEQRKEAPDPFTFECEETPFSFASPKETLFGAPIQIYVSSDPPTFVQTRLDSIRCNDETGGDALGDDEIVLQFGGVTDEALAVGDLEAGFNVYRADMNAGDTLKPKKLLSSVPSKLSDTSQGDFVVELGEDDDVGVMQIGTIVVTTVGGAIAGTLTPIGVVGGAIGGGAAGVGVAFGLADKPFFDPDEFIGRDGWVANATDMVSRGLQSHTPPVDMVPKLQQRPATASNVMGVATSGHPGVATGVYSTDADVIACTSDAACNTSKPICYANGCVSTSWVDPTLPVPFNPATDSAGHCQRWNLDNDGGDGANYDVRITTAVSGTQFPP